MAYFQAILLTALAYPESTALRPVRTFEPVAGHDLFLQRPFSLDIDDRGRIFIADTLAKTVFVWGPDGKFITNFGTEGRGPGEFSFTGYGQGGEQAYVSTHENLIYVYDGTARTIHVFDERFQFLHAIPFFFAGGRTEMFRVIGPDTFLIYHRSYHNTDPEHKVLVIDNKGALLRTLSLRKDKTFTRNTRSGIITGVTYHAFAPTLTVHYHRGTSQVLIGFSNKPSFSVFDTEGKKLDQISFALAPRAVTQEDRNDYMAQDWIKDSKFLNASFPDYMSYYDRILPVGDSGHLVYYISRVNVRVDGVWLDQNGRVHKKIDLDCGEGGMFFGARGRLIAARTNADGDLILQEVRP